MTLFQATCVGVMPEFTKDHLPGQEGIHKPFDDLVAFPEHKTKRPGLPIFILQPLYSNSHFSAALELVFPEQAIMNS